MKLENPEAADTKKSHLILHDDDDLTLRHAETPLLLYQLPGLGISVVARHDHQRKR